MVKTTEHLTITVPIGTSEKAKKYGVNMSFHSAKAIQKEIDRCEKEALE